MVGTNKALESEYLTVAYLKDSENKHFIVLGEGKYQETDYGTKLRIPVEINGQRKTWTPNKDSIKNCRNEWGENTTGWVGKMVRGQIINVQGKEAINAFPMETKVKEEKQQ